MRMGEANLELRAKLESALILLDRIGECSHNDEYCDASNACENGETTEQCFFDEEKDEMVHNHHSCQCLVWDAQTMSAGIRDVLKRTLQRPPHPPKEEP